MSVSTLLTKNRVSLPQDIVEAAHLELNDEIAWTVDVTGRILGRKVDFRPEPGGKLQKDEKTGRLYWDSDYDYNTLEEAALNANPIRE